MLHDLETLKSFFIDIFYFTESGKRKFYKSPGERDPRRRQSQPLNSRLRQRPARARNAILAHERFWIKSHRIRQAGKREIAQFHRRNEVAVDAFGFAQRFDVVQHDHRTFIETEIFDRKFDLPVFNIIQAVAR